MSSQGYPGVPPYLEIRLRGGCIVATTWRIPVPSCPRLISDFQCYPMVSSSSRRTTDLGVTGSSPVGRTMKSFSDSTPVYVSPTFAVSSIFLIGAERVRFSAIPSHPTYPPIPYSDSETSARRCPSSLGWMSDRVAHAESTRGKGVAQSSL
jgi:hypothetical protein